LEKKTMAVQVRDKWQVNLRYKGQLYRPRFPTKAQAEKWEWAAKAAREEGLPLPPFDTKRSRDSSYLETFVREVFEDLWGSNKSRKKYFQYVDELLAYFGPSCRLTDITTKRVDEYVSHLRSKGNGDGTINRKLSVLSKLLKKALHRDEIRRLPVIQRKRESTGRKRFMTKEEEQQLIANLQTLGHDQAAMRCLFMLYTGARDIEVRSLKWSDVDGDKVTLEGKGSHRTVYLSERAREALEWSMDRSYPKPFPMSYEAFKEQWDAASHRMGKLNDPGWVPYIMRHTCASRLVQRGVDIRRVRDWMGHSSITTTMTYAHLAPNDLEMCRSVLDE
jgi:integrase